MEIEKEIEDIKYKLSMIEKHVVNLNVTIQQSKLIQKPYWVEQSENLHSEPLKIDQTEFKVTVDSFGALLDELKKGIELIDPKQVYNRQERMFNQFHEMKESIGFLIKYINKGKKISVSIDGILVKDDEEIKSDKSDVFEFLEMDIDDSELSYRTGNILRALNLKKWKDVYKYSVSELLKTRNFGKKSIKELQHYFQKHGIVFK
jgi:hypothetical protein